MRQSIPLFALMAECGLDLRGMSRHAMMVLADFRQDRLRPDDPVRERLETLWSRLYSSSDGDAAEAADLAAVHKVLQA